MGFAEDYEDDGGYFAEQDSYAEECEKREGDCRHCPHRRSCQSSDYNKRRLGKWA